MKVTIVDVKHCLCDKNLYSILTPSIFNPTPERLLNRAEKYQKNEKTRVFAYRDAEEYKGIIVFEIVNSSATILDIAVKPECQRNGIGSKLIDFIFNQFEIDKVIAETDDDAIGFYKKYGFAVADTKAEFDTKRYVFVCESVTHHYDLLIAENNDPVHDPKPLQDYMDKWDGQAFIDKMELDKDKTVLEIGVGTGRLAVRVAPNCNHFVGIDISPKTIERAKENLKDYKNATLICDDFIEYKFDTKFDVIYSSLTFMHIKNKQRAIKKIASLLNDGGHFVLSIDKNQNDYIEYYSRKIHIYPDSAEKTAQHITNARLTVINQYETEFAYIFVARKIPDYISH